MRVYLPAVLAALVAAACWAAPARKVDTAAEAVAVRALDSTLNDAIQRRDLDAVVGAYAPDAALLWQNDPRMSGPDIRKAWEQAFGLDGFALRLHSRGIRVAQAGDLALDEGALELELPGPHGIIRNPGKYLVVWRKMGNAWKILYDVYNTDPTPSPAVGVKGE